MSCRGSAVRIWSCAVGLVAGIVLAGQAWAEPNLSSPRVIDGVRIFPDAKKAHRFYFAPLRLEAARSSVQGPKVQLIQARYMGTSVRGSEGEFSTTNTLSFGLQLRDPSPKLRKHIEKQLKVSGKRVRLAPLPLDRVEVKPSLVGLADQERLELSAPKAEESEGASARNHWTERTYTLSMDSDTAQLVWQSFQAGRMLLSVEYSIFARGVQERGPKVEVATVHVVAGSDLQGGEEEGEDYGEVLKNAAEKDKPQLVPMVKAVLADSFTIEVDGRRYPKLAQRFDLNRRAPAGYPILRILCYDFQNGLEPSLRKVQVELAAQGVDGSTVRHSVQFSRREADLTSIRVQFPFSVRIDRPYRYQVSRYLKSGQEHVSKWRTVDAWAAALNVTAQQD